MTNCKSFDGLVYTHFLKFKLMKIRISFIVFCIVTLCYACSSDDSSNEDSQMMDPTLQGHYSLRLNGAGFSDLLVELDRDTINYTGNKIIFRASNNDFSKWISFAIPQPLETVQYSIGEYVFENPSWALFSNNNSELFYSESGTVIISEIINNGENCSNVKGSLNFELSLDGDGNEIVNIQGTFDIPTRGCEL